MKSKAMAASALIVAGAGYLIGVLTAPKSGKETRKDIAKGASKARIQSERQLKKLHSELQDLIKDGEAVQKKAGAKAKKEIEAKLMDARMAKDKAREILSTLHHGDADDPNLKAMVKEVRQAKKDLMTYLKKK